MSIRRSVAVLLILVATGCTLIGDPENRYWRCMLNAGFHAYEEGEVTRVADGVEVLRIIRPSPESDTPEFQAKSRECLERVGRDHLTIISD